MTATDEPGSAANAHAVTEFDISTMTFESLVLAYDTRVLEPRPWTAMQSRWAVELLAGAGEDAVVVDLCTGVGNIGLLAAAEAGSRLLAVDVDPVACAFALGNAERAGLLDRVEVRCANMEHALEVSERFDVIVADPPWVPSERVENYPQHPALAIDGGADGLDLARMCVRIAQRHLTETGTLLLQLGTTEQCDQIVHELPPSLRESGRRRGDGGWVLALSPAVNAA